MSTFLGLDLGTSATKGVILDDEGRAIARARAVHPASRSGRIGRADPAAWQASILEVCRKLGPALADVAAVGLDTHCPTIVPLGEAGQPVTPGITWDNPQLTRFFATYSGRRSEADVQATGNHPSQSTFAAVAYHFVRELEPEAFAQLRTLGLAGTWMGHLLTGQLAVDPTQASYTGVFDTIGPDATWLTGALADLDIDPAVLPPIKQPLDVLGEATTAFAAEAGLPVGIPVVVGSADTPAASFALGTTPGRNPFLIMGTTHVVNSCLDAPDLRAKALQRRGLRPGEWLINGVTNGGDVLALAAAQFGFGGEESAVKELIRLATELPHEALDGAPVFVPHLMPERGPFWFEQPCAGLAGLTRSTTRAQLARAVLEGVIFADRMLLESIIPPGEETIFLTGAFGEDPVLPQLLADATGRSYRVALEPDLPAMGAAAMSAAALGQETPCALATSDISPQDGADEVLAGRWVTFVTHWSEMTGREPLPPLPADATNH